MYSVAMKGRARRPEREAEDSVGVQRKACHPEGQTDKPKERSAAITLGQEVRRS